MRRQLVAGAAAVTATVVVAFLVPLALLVRSIAADRAMDAAELGARAVAPVVSVSTDPAVVEPALAAVGGGLQLTAYLPDGTVLGIPAPVDAAVRAAQGGRSLRTPTGDSPNVVVPVVGPEGTTTVVRAALPPSALTRGVGRAWAMLAAVGVGLLAVAMLVADRLARTIVLPTAALAEVAGRLGAGQLEARFAPAGPPEVRDVGAALNTLAERIRVLLAAERELVADLSHRLRTPLTALRLDVDAIAEPEESRRLRDDVDALEAEVDGIIRRARDPLQAPVAAQADLAQVVRSRTAFWAPLAEDQGRAWHVSIANGRHPVPVAPDDLAAAVDVLVENVIAHTPETAACRIIVDAGQHGSRLIVEDAGPGFGSGPVLGRGASSKASTGLGLDIARRLVESTGGRFAVEKPDAGGARVVLEFGREGA